RAVQMAPHSGHWSFASPACVSWAGERFTAVPEKEHFSGFAIAVSVGPTGSREGALSPTRWVVFFCGGTSSVSAAAPVAGVSVEACAASFLSAAALIPSKFHNRSRLLAV